MPIYHLAYILSIYTMAPRVREGLLTCHVKILVYTTSTTRLTNEPRMGFTALSAIKDQ